jgi:hypothetical protein
MAFWKTVTRFAMVAALGLIFVSSGPLTRAQTPNPTPALVISILEGEGALNDIRQRTAREPIVEVEDENHKPIAGAAVLFTLPGSGPGGAFAEGAQTFSTVTDSAGRAVARGLQPNSISGSYNIRVHVSFNGSTAETNIHQQNFSGQSSVANHAAHAISVKTILVVVGAAAAAGTVAAILATRGGSSTTITAGPPTVGAPSAAASPGIRIPLHFHSH